MSAEFEDLKRLSEMLEQGHLSQDEFDRLKASLLAQQPSTTPSVRSSQPASETRFLIHGQTRWWLIGAGALMAIGSLLPWAQAGIFSFAGTQGDGVITLILGVITVLVGVSNRANFWTGIGTVIDAGISLLIVATVYSNIAAEGVGSVGGGLYVTGIGSLGAGMAGLELIGEARQRRAEDNLEAKVSRQVEEALATQPDFDLRPSAIEAQERIASVPKDLVEEEE